MRRLRSAAGPREVYTRLEQPERRSTEVIIQELRRPETARMELRPERRRDLRRAEIQERLQLLLRRIRPEIQPAAHPEIRQEPEWRLEITRQVVRDQRAVQMERPAHLLPITQAARPAVTRPAVLGTHPVQPAALPAARLPQPPPAAVQVLRP